MTPEEWAELKLVQTRAHYTVKRAIAKGRLLPASDYQCSRCGVSRATVYHHTHGYEGDNILRVVPLCYECHGIVHPGLRWRDAKQQS